MFHALHNPLPADCIAMTECGVWGTSGPRAWRQASGSGDNQARIESWPSITK